MTDSDNQQPSIFLTSLAEGLQLLRLALDSEVLAQMERFAELLAEANSRMNLTSITDPSEVAVKHFADSLSLLTLTLPSSPSIIDVGTGGGFPGIPLAIARPDASVTLLDATQKKIRFLEEAAAALGLANCRTVVGRAESAGREPEMREQFDVAVARGLGSLAEDAELCLPFVRVGGCAVAMKGPKAMEEIAAARSMAGQLGGAIDSSNEVPLPGGLQHRLIVLTKVRPTPAPFPRPWAKIRQKKPSAPAT